MKKPITPRTMRMAEQIMSADHDVLKALADTEANAQMPVARDIMKRRRSALSKLGK